MPRQDVPYGGAICRLRERIAEIFDKLGEKLHTINGVPGDGDGNVKIVSGSSAVVISNDPTQNEISVALDTSQLPAASVSSVNGQTGAVVLNAENIASDGGFDVQADIDALNIRDGTLQSNINAEVLARQGADSALQSNINAVSASLPAAAAAAVAADPTVAQLVTDLGNKVDLSDVSTVETPDTIAKRNGSGRLVAADPASGATDKTLTTANWISQTGESKPNNIMHVNGNDRFRSHFEQTGFSNSAGSSQGVNLQIIRASDDITKTVGAIAISRNLSGGAETTRQYMFTLQKDNQNWIRLALEWVNTNNTGRIVLYKNVNGVLSAATVATL